MGQPKKERVKKEPAEPKKPKKEGTDIKQFVSKVRLRTIKVSIYPNVAHYSEFL